MAQKNAATISAKWSRNLSAATQSITDGVNAVTESPTAAAAAKKNEMLVKLQNAVNNGKWERGLARVSLADWKTAMIEKGVQRVSQGAQKAEPKMTRFLQDFLPVAAAVHDQVKSMPKLTDEDSLNRVRVAMQAFKAFGASRR